MDKLGIYKADLSKNSDTKLKGVSGIMRVKNDAEFIEASIESCISALDELIIVYNDCSDDTPNIIQRMKEKYPNIIKAYEYKPKIYSVGLSEEEFKYAQTLPEDSINLLANYYNYALSKVSYEFVVKIDADQIYFTEALKEVLDAYRGSLKLNLKIRDFYSFIIIFINLFLNKVFRNKIININASKYFRGYQKALLYLVKRFKIPLSLSGINVFYYERKWYVTLGDVNKNLNILPPYNGVGDHIIFKITSKTKYIPYVLPSYNLMTSRKFSIIEKFKGVSSALPYGLLWFHMNSIRYSIYGKQIENFKHCPEKFREIECFYSSNFEELIANTPLSLLSGRVRNIFKILHNGSASFVPIAILKKYKYSRNYRLIFED